MTSKSLKGGGGGGASAYAQFHAIQHESKDRRTPEALLADDERILRDAIYASTKAVEAAIDRFRCCHPTAAIGDTTHDTLSFAGSVHSAAIRELTDVDGGVRAWGGVVSSIRGQRTPTLGATQAFFGGRFALRRGDHEEAARLFTEAAPMLKDGDLQATCKERLRALQAVGTPMPKQRKPAPPVAAKPKPESDDDDKKSSGTCKVCMTADSTVVLLPCLHLLMCVSCYETMKKKSPVIACPICRGTVADVIVALVP